MASRRLQQLSDVLEDADLAVAQVPTGTLLLERARDLRPDVIMLDADLPDMSGVDVCGLLHTDLRIEQSVPILMVIEGAPSPEQRVHALQEGVWDFVGYPWDPEELSLKLPMYVQARRNMDVALAEGLADPRTGLHSRSALARRAREMGALLARERSALACIVFALDIPADTPLPGNVLVRLVRLSDLVGALSPHEFAILAPSTGPAGAVALAQRAATALAHATVRELRPFEPGSTLRGGYDAVTNLMYRPLDPVDLLTRAASAVRSGTPEPGSPWLRRFDGREVSAAVVERSFRSRAGTGEEAR